MVAPLPVVLAVHFRALQVRLRITLLLCLGSLFAGPTLLTAQTAPAVSPSQVTLGPSSDVASVTLDGKEVGAFTGARVIDPKDGSAVSGFRIALGGVIGTQRDLSISTGGVAAGTYGVELIASRSIVPIRLQIVVEVAGPAVQGVDGPATVLTGEGFSLTVTASGDQGVRYIFTEVDRGLIKTDADGGRSVRVSARLAGIGTAGAKTVSVRAVDPDGNEGEPYELRIDVVDPPNVAGFNVSPDSTTGGEVVPGPPSMSANFTVTLTATERGVSQSAPLSLYGSPSVGSLGVAPQMVMSGEEATLTIGLVEVAPPGGATLTVGGGGNPEIPSSYVIPEGDQEATFTFTPIITGTDPQTQTFSARSIIGDWRLAQLEILPTPELLFFAMSPGQVAQAGGSVVMRVGLATEAPPGGVTVSLGSDRTDLLGLPPTVEVLGTEMSFSLPITDPGLPEIIPATATATLGGSQIQRPLEIYPAQPFLTGVDIIGPQTAFYPAQGVLLTFSFEGIVGSPDLTLDLVPVRTHRPSRRR